MTTGLRQALPYLRLYQGRTFVVKAGGAVFQDPEATDQLLEQIGILHQVGVNVALVHGGGPQTTALATRLGLDTTMVGGRRVTDAETIQASAMALNGQVRTSIVARLRKHGVRAAGLSGVDVGLATATRRPPVRSEGGELVDFGYVGDLASVDPTILDALFRERVVPVISPLSADAEGQMLNVNADTFAARLAVECGAIKLILISDVPGLMEDPADPASLISYVDAVELDQLEASGIVAGGMRPKVAAIRAALAGGVPRAHLIGHRTGDGLIAEVFTNEGCGTMFVRTRGELDPSEANAPDAASIEVVSQGDAGQVSHAGHGDHTGHAGHAGEISA